jgi:hypothetical protein
MMKRCGLPVLAYLVPTFALDSIWHMNLLEGYYAALAIYRSDMVAPFGFLSMLVQSIAFAWI